MENITKVASRAPHSKMNFALQCPENEGGMNERVKRLHQQSIGTTVLLSLQKQTNSGARQSGNPRWR